MRPARAEQSEWRLDEELGSPLMSAPSRRTSAHAVLLPSIPADSRSAKS